MDASDRRKRAAEEAAEWWVQLQGDVSRVQREQYVDWLRESALHVAEMLRVAQVHGALAQFKRWDKVPTDGADDAEERVVPLSAREGPNRFVPASPKHPPRRLRFMAAAAAACVLIITGGLFLYRLPDQVIQTERGERREVALADGSVVQVDPETRLRVNYETHIRHVYLERGRALFHVAKNAQRPFLVKADETTVRAVGTAFAVEQGQGNVVVTVAEGKVAVLFANVSEPLRINSDKAAGTVELRTPGSTGGASLRSSAVSGANDTSAGELRRRASGPANDALGEIFLTANEQVIVGDSGTAEPVREVDSRRALAWAEGRLVFDNESVEQAVREFNRYNRVRLTVNDAALARRTISGVFGADDPESFVGFLQSVATVHVTRDDASNITVDAAK